jgi:hypothetical protein
MAWTSMHFAVGMCGGAAAMAFPCLILRRGWRHIPLAMTLGGIWANIPDSPRLWRVDFPGLPFAETLGSMDLETWLHSIGDLFFFHQSLDAQPKEFALLGLVTIIGLYNLCLVLMLWHARRGRQRTVLPLHGPTEHTTMAGTSEPQRFHHPVSPQTTPPTPPPAADGNPVIGRIGSG